MSSIVETGLSGVMRGLSSAAQHASEITQAFVAGGSEDATAPIIGLSQDKLQVEASSEVIKVGDELSKSALDLLA